MKQLEQIYEIHDITCNQKYDGTLPYSFHLKAVIAQAEMYTDIAYLLIAAAGA